MPTPDSLISVSDATPPFFAGVDIGGTSIKLGLVDDQGRTIGFDQIATEEERGAEDAIARCGQALRDLAADSSVDWQQLAAVGLGTPGSMDIPQGLILEPPNMPHWRYFPLRDRLADTCQKRVAFANDANAAAFGEYWVGSGRQYPSMAMFTLGTGVGGGIILAGRSIDGENSFGSELGHIMIDHGSQARTCVWGGGQGQLEAYASAPAVVARTQEQLDQGRASSLVDRVRGGDPLTAKLVSEEAERGDELSREIVQATARFLAIGIVNVVHTVDPGAVILGGAMNFGGTATETGRLFLSCVRDEFRERAYHVVRDTVIEFASLAGDAGYIGAAGIARSMLTEDRLTSS